MSTDSIADMLTRIRNANTAGHSRVAIPASRVGVEIARVLKEEGYIAAYDVAAAEQGQTRGRSNPQAVGRVLEYRIHIVGWKAVADRIAPPSAAC